MAKNVCFSFTFVRHVNDSEHKLVWLNTRRRHFGHVRGNSASQQPLSSDAADPINAAEKMNKVLNKNKIDKTFLFDLTKKRLIVKCLSIFCFVLFVYRLLDVSCRLSKMQLA